jgi:probable HAF family extracellular repeat protein
MALLAQSAQATAINNLGEVVGWLETGEGAKPFIHEDRLYYVGSPEGAAKAMAINDLGQVAGRWTSTTDKAFLEQNGTAEVIAPDINGYAVAMNNAGKVVIKQVEGDRFRALLWENGQLTDLGTLGGRSTQVRGINGVGQIVGWSETATGVFHAFLWENGRMIDLTQVPGEQSAAVAINDRGQILIKISSATSERNALWENGRLTDLDHFGASFAEVNDLNNKGQIVGWMVTESNRIQAFRATPNVM